MRAIARLTNNRQEVLLSQNGPMPILTRKYYDSTAFSNKRNACLRLKMRSLPYSRKFSSTHVFCRHDHELNLIIAIDFHSAIYITTTLGREYNYI